MNVMSRLHYGYTVKCHGQSFHITTIKICALATDIEEEKVDEIYNQVQFEIDKNMQVRCAACDWR